jgi:hypothetical protein
LLQDRQVVALLGQGCARDRVVAVFEQDGGDPVTTTIEGYLWDRFGKTGVRSEEPPKRLFDIQRHVS